MNAKFSLNFILWISIFGIKCIYAQYMDPIYYVDSLLNDTLNNRLTDCFIEQEKEGQRFIEWQSTLKKNFNHRQLDVVRDSLRNKLEFKKYRKRCQQRLLELYIISLLYEPATKQQANKQLKNLIFFDPDFGIAHPLRQIRLLSNQIRKEEDYSITSSNRWEHPDIQPNKTIVIHGEELIERGYHSLVDLFHDLPGFNVNIHYGDVHSNMSMRGFRTNYTEKILLLIDGIPEFDGWSGIIPLSRQYPLSNIERIEVSYGPSTSVNIENSFNGVIHLITKPFEKIIGNDIDEKKKFNYQITTGGTPFATKSGYVEGNVGIGGIRGLQAFGAGRIFVSNEMERLIGIYLQKPLIDYEARLNNPQVEGDIKGYLDKHNLPDVHPYYNVERDGEDQVPTINLTPEGALAAWEFDKMAYITNKPKPSWSLNWQASLNFKLYDFSMQFAKWDLREGLPASLTYQTDQKRWGMWRRSLVSYILKHEKQLTNKLYSRAYISYKTSPTFFSGIDLIGYSNQLQLHHLVNDTASSWSVPTGKDRFFDFGSQISKDLRGSILFRWPIKTLNLQNSGGLDVRNTELIRSYNTREDNLLSTWGGGIFSSSSFNGIRGTNVSFSLRGNFDVLYTTGYDDGYGIRFNPRLSIAHTPFWLFEVPLTIKFAYSEGTSYPTNWGKYPDISATGRPFLPINHDMKEESNRSYEISLRYDKKPLKSSIQIFRSTLSKIIPFIEDPYEIIYPELQNSDSYLIKGLIYDFYYDKKFPRKTLKRLKIYANYTLHQTKKTQENFESFSTPQPVLGLARHRFNLGGTAFLVNKFQVNLRANYVGKRYTLIDRSEMDPYLLLNGVFTYTSENTFQNWRFQFTVNNILNTSYEHIGPRIGTGINYRQRIPQPSRTFGFRVIFNPS